MEITHEKACHCALNRIFGFEPKIALALISHLGGAQEVFNLSPKDINGLLGPHSKYNGTITAEAVDQAYRELTDLSARGIHFIGWNETGYPPSLKECEDAPAGLYIRSTSPPEDLWLNRRMISIIGTRDLSPYGREWCERLVRSLADMPQEDRPVIVSGLALGVDVCAHNAALQSGLATIAVMATGPESVYPGRHRHIAEVIAETPGSALITDYPPGTAPLAIHFLRRNRIIAGLSEATLLVESKIKGGGMMTARLADSYNRTVLALPGRVDDTRSQGCNHLIRSRVAIPITSTQDFLKELGIKASENRKSTDDSGRIESMYKGCISDDKISQMGNILLAIRKERGILVEDIAIQTGIEYTRVSQLLGMLETDGIISRDLLQRCFINFSK